jgi:polysaccharide export outer membrane protein
MPPLRSLVTRTSFVVATSLLGGCAGAGQYVWITDLPSDSTAPAGAGEYLVRDGDVLNVRVFNQDALSMRARVRSDGRIAMPGIGDIDVRGKRPSSLKSELEARLKDYVNAPSVTVTVDEFQPINVAVLGEVGHPGTFPADPRTTIAQVLAAAGGLTEYASHDSIFVVRSAPQAMRIRFTYDDIRRGEPHTAAFSLRQGDLVVVE